MLNPEALERIDAWLEGAATDRVLGSSSVYHDELRVWLGHASLTATTRYHRPVAVEDSPAVRVSYPKAQRGSH